MNESTPEDSCDWRSVARMKWARSLVPMDTKSAIFTISWISNTAAGVSTMAPMGGRLASWSVSITSSTRWRASLRSATLMTMGNMIRTSPPCAACKIAWSWARNIAFSVRENAKPRLPIRKARSFSVRLKRGILSPPRSIVRITTGCGLSIFTTAE